MNKALVAILVIVLLAGVLVKEGDAFVPRGRDRIEKMQRAMEERQGAPERPEIPLFYRGGKELDH